MISALPTRCDKARRYHLQDIRDKDETTIAKIIIPTDSIDKAFHHAINDLKTNAHRYLETFEQD
jgi:hypothetical protein